MANAPIVVWYRQDLRIRDQAALVAAADTGRPVVPV
jgi:deoxyribodipyrimidine photo-lyase